MKQILTLLLILIGMIGHGQTPEKGYFLSFDGGIGFGGENRIAFNFVNGYRFNPHLELGVGIGARWFYQYDGRGFIYPVYAEFKARMGERSIKILLDLQAGYSFATERGFTWIGPYFRGGMGLDVPIAKKVSFFCLLGPEVITYREYYYLDHKHKLDGTVTFSMNLGLTFVFGKTN